MTAISKIVYIDKLVKIVEECNNIYIDFDIESNDKKPIQSSWSCKNIKI